MGVVPRQRPKGRGKRQKREKKKRKQKLQRQARCRALYSGPKVQLDLHFEKRAGYPRNGTSSFRHALTDLYVEKMRGRFVNENSFSMMGAIGRKTSYHLQNLPEKMLDWYISVLKRIFADSFGENSTFTINSELRTYLFTNPVKNVTFSISVQCEKDGCATQQH